MKSLRNLSLVLCGAFLLPSSALAEEAKAGLPQMDATFYVGEVFWLAVCFALLFVVMRYIALPAVQHTQEKRQNILSGDIAAAKAAEAEAKSLMAEYEKALAAARTQASAVVEGVLAKANKEASERLSKQQQDLNLRISSAEAKISEVRAAALAEARTVVDDLSKTIIVKVTQSKASSGA